MRRAWWRFLDSDWCLAVVAAVTACVAVLALMHETPPPRAAGRGLPACTDRGAP